MIKLLLKRVITTSLGRWALSGAVALVLGTAVVFWHNFKQDLRDEGRQVCIQVINEETVLALQESLAAERATATRLAVMLVAAAAENEEARARARAATFKVDALERARKEQEKTDETYAKWSRTPLPGGVADRLRNAQARSDAYPSNDDSN